MTDPNKALLLFLPENRWFCLLILSLLGVLRQNVTFLHFVTLERQFKYVVVAIDYEVKYVRFYTIYGRMRSMKAKLRDTEIYFDIEGLGLRVSGNQMKEYPTAFLIHGGPGTDHSSYKLLFSELIDIVQLVYFDHRGQGRSQRGDKQTYTLDNNVEDMEALRDHLGLDKIIVMGSSYGGMVALKYASRYPERVQALIVMATAGNHRFLDQAKKNLQIKGTPEQIVMAENLWNGTFRDNEHLEEYFKVMSPLYSLSHNQNSQESKLQSTIFSIDAINIAFSTFLREIDFIDQLHKITAPTLVIGAKEDWICPPEFSEEIAKHISNTTLKIIEDCGHLIRVDQPEKLIKEIYDFLTLIDF